MAREVITTGVLRLDTQDAEKNIAALDKRIDDLFAKARKGGGVGPLFGGGGGGGGGGGRPTTPVPDTAKLQKTLELQTRINTLMREAGVTYGTASTVARAYGDSMDDAGNEALDFARKLDKAKRETTELSKANRTSTGFFGKLGASVFAGVAAFASLTAVLYGVRRALTATYDKYTELEGATVSLRKVTDLDDQAFGQLKTKLENLSASSVPIATAQLLELGAAAAQMGIQSAEGIALAAETGAQLAQATDIQAEEAIKGLTRILAIQGEAVDSLDNLGSALVELGNTSRATESEIAPIANEIARSTANFDIASPVILGYAAALAEMGAKAEGSGTALAELFTALLVAGKTGKNLEAFANVAGITADRLRELAADDVSLAAQAFLAGLGKYGEDGILVLDELGLSSKRTAKALLPLAANADRLQDRIALSNESFRENVALDREAASAFDQLSADSTRAWNAIGLLATDGFAPLAEALSVVLRWIADTIIGFREMLAETAPLRDMLGTELAEALMIFDELFDVDNATSYFDAINKGGESTRTGILSWIPGMEKADFNLRSLAEKFIELGGVEGMLLTISGTFYQLAASAARSGAGIASGILNGIASALSGLSELASAIRDLPLVGELLAPAADAIADGIADASLSVAKLAADAKGLGEDVAVGLDDKAAKAFNRAIDVSNRKMIALRDATEELKKEASKGGDEIITPPDPEPFEEVAEAIAKITRELTQAKDTLRLMRDFGVDAEVARDAVKLLAEDGVNLTTEAAVELAKELHNARDAVSDLARERKALEAFNKSLVQVRKEAELVAQGLSLDDAAEAVRLMEDAGVDAATAVSMLRERSTAEIDLVRQAFAAGTISVERYMQALLSPAEFEQWRKNQQDAARILDGLKTRLDKYGEEIARINDLFASGDLTEEQRDKALAALHDQQEGWVRVAAAAAEAAANTEGAWSSVFAFLSENMGRLVDGFGMLGDILSRAGREDLGGLATGVSQLASGQIGVGIGSIAGGFGLSEGNFLAEGAAIGEQFGGVWGAVIGAALGSFVKKGKDDLHSQMREVSGRASLQITQAQGELAKVAPELSAFLEGFLNDVQDSVLADLDLAGAEFHIRGDDRFRVRLADGVERIFDNMEEATGFFLRGVLQANAAVDGLGENVRAFFEGASTFADNLGDVERLQEGMALAQRLDFEATGVDTQAIAAFRRELELAAEFGLPLEKVVALRQKEIDAVRTDLAVRARGVLGANDFAGSIVELTRGMEVLNNTTAKQAEMDAKRVAELEALIATQQEALGVTEDTTTGFHDAVDVQGRFRDGIARDRDALDDYNRGIDDSRRSHLEGRNQLQAYREELEALTASVESGTQAFTDEDIGRLWERAAADAGSALLDMIEAVEGPAATVEERQRLQHTIFLLQLHAQIQAAQAVLATMQFVSDASRELFQGIVSDAQQLFDDLASGEKTLNLGAAAGGGGRRQQKLQEEERAREEAARAAEEAAKRVEELTHDLRRLELNASSASGTLGDLAARIDDIRDSAHEAAEAGADAADVRRSQQLLLRQERERLLDPFTSTRRESFSSSSIDIEQARRDAVEQARTIAQAQAEILGVSFDAMFDGMVEDINHGAARMQAELNRSVVDALNLPLEQTRRSMQEFRQGLRDLDQMYARGEISQRRYLDLQEQIREQQAAAVSGQALSLLDRYYSEVEGREDLRRQAEIANFEIELATLRLRFNMLVAESALAQDVIDQVGGFIDFMESNPPDWDAFFAPPTGGVSIGGGRSSFDSSSVASDFSNLADAIRDFVHGFNQVDVGRFTAQANDWLKSLSDFERDITELLAEEPEAALLVRSLAQSLFGVSDIRQLTAEQLAEIEKVVPSTHVFADAAANLIDVLSAAGELDKVSQEAPQKILDLYEGTLEATNELAEQYASINDEFLDALAALEATGASAEQLAAAEAIHQQRIMEFLEDALSGFKSLSDEIRGGSFGGINTRQQIEEANDRADELRRRIAADPLDFEAMQELERELRNILALQEDFTGGVGPEFDRIVAEILGISDQVQAQVTGQVDPEAFTPADPAVLGRMDEQSTIFIEMRDSMEVMNERDAWGESRMEVLIDQNRRILAALTAGSPLTTVN